MAKILIIDDDQGVGNTVTSMLAQGNHEVVFESLSVRAFQMLSESTFDLVISDVFMPNCDGIELVLEIKRARPETKIILMTGGARYFPCGSGALSDITNSAEMLGAHATIQKPFGRKQLIGLVTQLTGMC